MKTYCTMTNREIIEAYKKASTQKSDISKVMIADGQGRLRLSDMRASVDVHPLASEYVALTEEVTCIWVEASVRYGPGLLMMDHLTSVQGPNYKRIKEKDNG